VKLYPDAIDTNYFYGDFLLAEGDYTEAQAHLEKAHRAPIRPTLRISDAKVKQEAAEALANARARKPARSDFFSLFTPNFDKN
jgi:Tfp pilus assembly protein PilF